MSFQKAKFGNFDFKLFKSQRIESPVQKNPGIYYVWYWNNEKKQYEYPPEGIKRYRAIRRVNLAGKSFKESQFFDQLESARIWRANREKPTAAKASSQADEPLNKGGPKFEEVVQMWKEAKWKTFEVSTQLVYERTLSYLDFFQGMEVRAITAQVVDKWLKKMIDPKFIKDQNATRQTFLHELELLSGIFRYYNEYRDDSRFVFPIKKRHREAAIVKVVRGKKRKPMTPEQFELWASALKNQKHGLLKEALARTQRSGALRVSEAAAIYWDDIDWEKRIINIHRSVMWPRCKGLKTDVKEGFKNGDEKVVPITPDASKLLRALFEERTCGLVFHLDEKPLEYRFIQYAYDHASRKAKVDFTGTHVMRRTGASWILNQTGDIDLAKELLGNTTWSSVKPYAQRESKALTDFNNKLWSEQGGNNPEPQCPKLRAVK